MDSNVPDFWSEIEGGMHESVRKARVEGGEECIMVWGDGNQVDFINFPEEFSVADVVQRVLVGLSTVIDTGSESPDEHREALARFADELGFEMYDKGE